MSIQHVPVNMQVFDLKSGTIIGMVGVKPYLVAQSTVLNNFIIDTDVIKEYKSEGQGITPHGIFILVKLIDSDDSREVYEVLYRDSINGPRFLKKIK